jgi:hypothetical protein
VTASKWTPSIAEPAIGVLHHPLFLSRRQRKHL